MLPYICTWLCWPMKWFSSHLCLPPHNTTGKSFCRVRRVKTLGHPARVLSPLRRRAFSLTNLISSTCLSSKEVRCQVSGCSYSRSDLVYKTGLFPPSPDVCSDQHNTVLPFQITFLSPDDHSFDSTLLIPFEVESTQSLNNSTS